MRIHTPGANVGDGEFAVHLNSSGARPFAVIGTAQRGTTKLYMESRADCDRLIRAAAEARHLLPADAPARTDLDAQPGPAAWPPGATFGELTPAQRAVAIEKAAAQLQGEITRAAPHIAKILDKADRGGLDAQLSPPGYSLPAIEQ